MALKTIYTLVSVDQDFDLDTDVFTTMEEAKKAMEDNYHKHIQGLFGDDFDSEIDDTIAWVRTDSSYRAWEIHSRMITI